jgi:hypothetical protein
LPSLHTLTLSLRGPKYIWSPTHTYPENESPLEQLRGMNVKGEFIVFINWPVTEFEKRLETKFGMRFLAKNEAEEAWKESNRMRPPYIEH